MLNDDGSPLTSYQKHLLALARAMIRKPRILLWEEDLSIMDSSALNVLTNYLDKVRERREGSMCRAWLINKIKNKVLLVKRGEAF